MKNHAATVEVEDVEWAVRTLWWAEALEAPVDAVVVLNHFGWNDALVQVLRGAVRERKPRVPLVFLSGYTPKFGLILN